ncbi:MAG: sugar ABC transporter permease [Thermomicrobiales bacterium]|nr:sugar ABC transporter permease [Thermomicrobiales bacterium]
MAQLTLAETQQSAAARSTFERLGAWLSRFALPWLYLLPTVIFFIGWAIYPIARVAWISLLDYRPIDASRPVTFIGLENYVQAFSDPLLWLGIKRAAVFTAVFLPGMIFIPMFLAVLIDRVTQPKLATFYRLILLIPAMIPGPLIFLLWKWMYDGYIGPINFFLVDVFHLFTIQTQPQWMSNQLVIPSLAIMEWWWGLGYHTMFYVAGLATIPRDLFDASRVDGANEWKMFWTVTFWRLLPVTLVLVVLRFGTAMAVIDEYLLMGGFLRDRPTYTWTVYMWDTAFQGVQSRGYAAAIGWVGTIVMLIVVAILFWAFRNRD